MTNAVHSGGGTAAQPGSARQRDTRVALASAGVAVFMLGMSFAAVPLYQIFCQVTGFGGTTQVAVSPSDVVLEQTITVRLDSNVGGGLGWTFEPVERRFTIKIGDNALGFYRATNISDRPLVGMASYNVTPEAAGIYFNKMACFCFTEQTLQPGESVEMPVSFYIDPQFASDKNTRRISEITLSYTFFPVDKPELAVGGVAPPDNAQQHAPGSAPNG
ncbi:MAG: cytochrome c oxidase assembly protein [Hyphomicrobiaceae bacterium]